VCRLVDRSVSLRVSGQVFTLAVSYRALTELPVERSALKKRIKFYLLETAWRTQALLVARRYVTRGRFALSFRLGAFKYDQVPCHDGLRI